MDERMHFVIRLEDGESMATLCREFGISRKTGYKILDRYEECGLEGLNDRARRPKPAKSESSAHTKTPHATLGGFARGAWAVIV